MPGASIESITGRLGVGAIAFLGLFLIVDGIEPSALGLVETMGKTTTWGIIGVVPTVVVTYMLGVFCLSIADAVLSGVSSLAWTKPKDIIAVSATGSALLQQLYSEHLRNHELLKGASVSFLILAIGCIAETPKLGYDSLLGWLFISGAIALAILSLIFARDALRRSAVIAEAAYAQLGNIDQPSSNLEPMSVRVEKEVSTNARDA